MGVDEHMDNHEQIDIECNLQELEDHFYSIIREISRLEIKIHLCEDKDTAFYTSLLLTQRLALNEINRMITSQKRQYQKEELIRMKDKFKDDIANASISSLKIAREDWKQNRLSGEPDIDMLRRIALITNELARLKRIHST